jgi:two-component system LytT family sensor kinase
MDSFKTHNKPLTIITHVIFWALIFTLPILIRSTYGNSQEGDFQIGPVIIYGLLIVSLFYLNAYSLIPYILKKNGAVWYILVSFFFLVIFFICNKSAAFLFAINSTSQQILLRTVIPFFFIWGISSSYRIILDNYKQEKEKKEKENESLKTELSFLRSQVSPHFMFNVLNSLVALIRQKSDKLEPVVIELSNLMRYMLYESDQETVNLKTEIEYLKSYVDIQMIRFGDKIKIVFEIPKYIPDRSIEPMLIIPLIENAFKHGAVINNPEIIIRISFVNDQLQLSVKNKYSETHKPVDKTSSGIGLKNLKRRLSLSYRDAHELEITKENNWYNTQLTVNMKK